MPPALTLPSLLLLIAPLAAASAGPPPPCVGAVTSSNGQFLAVTDVLLEPAGGGAYKSKQGTINVYGKVRYINQWLTSPDTYWDSQPQWTLVLKPNHAGFVNVCLLSLLTDDGQFLILLNQESEFDPGLQIYRSDAYLGFPPPAWPIRASSSKSSVGVNCGQGV